jgi:hypothetical protein
MAGFRRDSVCIQAGLARPVVGFRSGLLTLLLAGLAGGAGFLTAANAALAVEVKAGAKADASTEIRPPATPLVAHDPYFSVWCPADRLTDAWSVHWTGKRNALQSMVRVDDQVYRLAGPEPASVPALPQKSVKVLPTRTIYEFANEQVAVQLTFMSAALPQDIEVLSRPVTYVTWEVKSLDGASHAASVYFDAAAEWTVNTPDQPVVWTRPDVKGLDVLRAGSQEQRVLARRGDDLRIEWGYLYVAAPAEESAQVVAADAAATRGAFTAGKSLPHADEPLVARPAKDAPVLAFALDFGKVGEKAVSRHLLVAYDDIYSIRYFGQKLRPYWRRAGAEAADLLLAAEGDYTLLADRCASFDKQLVEDLTQVGGPEYAAICSLAYRHSLAANKIVADAAGQPLMFSKENFSNGCIATVDVLYPAAPELLLFSPALMKASLVPLLDYAMSPRWKWPFAPHDLGTYPLAEGQAYGGGERTEENQMPVEESGNMLILMAAVARAEGNADFAEKYWPVLSKWAEYLVGKGFDPEKQLCTDDFAGHLAHNVNLSVKAIEALAAYSMLCEMRGRADEADNYRHTAREYAAKWVKLADDGDHYRLAFDKPGTWSQKYNMVWERVLGLGAFPPEVAAKELAFYRKTQQTYGLPLDNRQPYTKIEWTTWTATLGSPEDFRALVAPLYKYVNETPSRVPMSDWHFTNSGKKSGFQARSVVGGLFIKMLADPQMWQKYVKRAATVSGAWAPLPKPPEYRPLMPTAVQKPQTWRYTLQKPADDWYGLRLDDSAWAKAPGGFGTSGTPGGAVGTVWSTPDIWLRTEFKLRKGQLREPKLMIHHDEDAEVYINGVPAARLAGYTSHYEAVDIEPAAIETLRPGKNVIAIHCHQTSGGQYIDAGIVDPK